MVDQEDIERRVDFLVREADELIALSVDPFYRSLVRQELLGIEQVYTRMALILSYFNRTKPTQRTLDVRSCA